MAKKKEPNQEFVGVKVQFSCDCHDPTCVSCHGTGFFEEVLPISDFVEYLRDKIADITQEEIRLDKHLSRNDD
jgi:hypothetical protein